MATSANDTNDGEGEDLLPYAAVYRIGPASIQSSFRGLAFPLDERSIRLLFESHAPNSHEFGYIAAESLSKSATATDAAIRPFLRFY
jgi:hypothetical protein